MAAQAQPQNDMTGHSSLHSTEPTQLINPRQASQHEDLHQDPDNQHDVTDQSHQLHFCESALQRGLTVSLQESSASLQTTSFPQPENRDSLEGYDLVGNAEPSRGFNSLSVSDDDRGPEHLSYDPHLTRKSSELRESSLNEVERPTRHIGRPVTWVSGDEDSSSETSFTFRDSTPSHSPKKKSAQEQEPFTRLLSSVDHPRVNSDREPCFAEPRCASLRTPLRSRGHIELYRKLQQTRRNSLRSDTKAVTKSVEPQDNPSDRGPTPNRPDDQFSQTARTSSSSYSTQKRFDASSLHDLEEYDHFEEYPDPKSQYEPSCPSESASNSDTVTSATTGGSHYDSDRSVNSRSMTLKTSAVVQDRELRVVTTYPPVKVVSKLDILRVKASRKLRSTWRQLQPGT